MPDLDQRRALSARLASIRALADAVNGRMAADDTQPADPAADPPADPPKDTSKGNDKPGKGEPKPDDKPTPPKGDDDGTDWKRESRKHENYAKANKVAADKAAEEKAAADKAREEAEAKNTEMRDALAKYLGFKDDDTPADPAKLQQAVADRERDIKSKDDAIAAKDEEIAARERTIAARDVELAAWREATKQGLDAATLLDLRSTERNLGTLDFAADDFGASLAALITKAAKDNPALRAREASPADAGIGTAGSNDVAAAAAPGVARLRAAYGSTTH